MTTPTRCWRVIAPLLCCFNFAAAAGAEEVVGTVAKFTWEEAAEPGQVAYYRMEVNRYDGDGWQLLDNTLIPADERTASVTGNYGESIRVRVQAVGADFRATSEYSPESDLVTFVDPATLEDPTEPVDLCPNDPDKTEPGLCGCGASDVDSDGDGTPDCLDLCADNPDKTEPGICGCGTSDKDSDGDGTPDCDDVCFSDRYKTDPGICGCGTSDKDSDRDGMPDCDDECYDDPNKTDPGICGCNTSDVDSDGNGTPDCLDEPPPGDPAELLDFNADGRADLLIRSPSTGAIKLWLPTDRSPGWIQAEGLDPAFEIVGNGDYDGNGYADLLAHHPATGVLEIRLLKNGQTVDKASFQLEPNWEVVGSADYDGNGYADFLLRNRATNELQLQSLYGTELLPSVPIKSLPSTAEILGSGDYDGDGRHDILWQRAGDLFGDSHLFVWYLDDPANPAEEEAPGIEWGWQVVGTGDYDGDGTSDVLLREQRTGELRMDLFSSSTISEQDLRDNSGDFPSRSRDQYTVVGSADFDGDGRCDIALLGRYGDLLLLYMDGPQAQAGLLLENVPASVAGVGLENPH